MHLPSPHVITTEKLDVPGFAPLWRSSCTVCEARSPWTFTLSESVDAVWFAPTYSTQAA